MDTEQHTACEMCGAPVEGDMRAHLRAEHPKGDWPMAYRNKNGLPDDVMIGVGAGRGTPYILGIWPDEMVHRDTLRRILPPLNKNQRIRFTDCLSKLERDGIIRREGMWVRILDHVAAYVRAVAGMHDPQHEKFIDLRLAIQNLETSETPAHDDVEAVRRREGELRFIESLMRPYQGPMSGSGRPVRVVAAGRVS